MAPVSAPRCRRRLSAYALTVAAAVLLAACASAPVTVTVNNTVAPPSPESPLPTTDSGIHLGLAFDYNMTTAPAAGKIDHIWGGLDTHLGWGVNSGYYIPWARDWDTRTLAWWQANHPDWIVYKNDRTTVAYEFGDASHIPLDISNPAVRAFQAAQIESQYSLGYAGVSFDNVNTRNDAQQAGVWHGSTWVPLFTGAVSGDSQFHAAQLAWITWMYNELKTAYPDRIVTANIGTGDDPAWLAQLLPYVDVFFDEVSMIEENGMHFVTTHWNNKKAMYDETVAAGKALVQNHISQAANDAAVPAADVEWVVANYLIFKGSHSYMNLYSQSPNYGSFYDRPEFSIPIGTPTGTATADGNGIWSRLFTGGRVYSNPTTTSRSITLPAGYANLHGGAVGTSVTLPAATARIFLTVPG